MTTTDQTSAVETAEGLLCELAQALVRAEDATAEMNLRINEVKADYAGRLAGLERKAERLRYELEVHCAEHRSDLLPGKRKSASLLFGRVGWRSRQPSLKHRRGKSGEAIAQWLLDHGFERLVRTRPEPNKEVIRDALDAGDISQRDLKAAGLRLVGGAEEFYAKPDLEKVREALEA